MKFLKSMVNNVCTAREKHSYHMNTNGLVLPVAKAVLKEKLNLIKFQGKKIIFINRLKYAQHKIVCICRVV